MNENDPRPDENFFSWGDDPADESAQADSRAAADAADWQGGNYPPDWQAGPDEAQSAVARNRTVLIVAAAVALTLIISTIAFALIIRDNRNLTADPPPPAAASPSGQDSSAAPDTAEPGASASASSDSSPSASPTPSSSPSSDSLDTLSCTSPNAAAQTATAYANAAGSSPETLRAALAQLSQSCDPGFTAALAAQLRNARVPAAFSSITTGTSWWHQARPAPENAVERQQFTTPAKNIFCTLSEDKVACSINAYDWPAPQSCTGRPATVEVGLSNEPHGSCGTPILSGETVAYGAAVKRGAFACTAEESGVSCWSVLSGHGFRVNRASVETF